MFLDCFEKPVDALDMVGVAALQLDNSDVGEVQRKQVEAAASVGWRQDRPGGVCRLGGGVLAC